MHIRPILAHGTYRAVSGEMAEPQGRWHQDDACSWGCLHETVERSLTLERSVSETWTGPGGGITIGGTSSGGNSSCVTEGTGHGPCLSE